MTYDGATAGTDGVVARAPGGRLYLVTALQASMKAESHLEVYDSRLLVSANQTAIPSLSGIAHHRIWGSSGNSSRQAIYSAGGV